MTLKDICPIINAEIICGDNTKTFSGVYIGDLLSRAMSHVQADNLWITIMSNANVVAVAVLTEPSAVILAENVELDPTAKENAIENNITVIKSPLTAYEISVRIFEATVNKVV